MRSQQAKQASDPGVILPRLSYFSALQASTLTVSRASGLKEESHQVQNSRQKSGSYSYLAWGGAKTPHFR